MGGGPTPQMRGRFADQDVLAEASHWDPVTRRVVLERVASPPAYRFFDTREQACLEPFCDTVTAQDREPRIAVLRYIDERLADRKLDGFQYVGLPDDPELWRVVARGLEEAGFAEARPELRRQICEDFATGRLEGAAWRGVDVKCAWSVVMRYVLTAFYAHPWAWNEIGFPGPAYPRGYSRFAPGLRESWEGEERR